MDTIFDLLIQDNAATEVACSVGLNSTSGCIPEPWVSVCNHSQGTAPDGLLGWELPHLRAYGTVPLIERKYIRKDGALTLPDAIRKFSRCAPRVSG